MILRFWPSRDVTPAPELYRLVDYVGPETSWQIRHALLRPEGTWALETVTTDGPEILVFVTTAEAIAWVQRQGARLLLPPSRRRRGRGEPVGP